MLKIKLRDRFAGIVLGCCLFSGSFASAQIVVQGYPLGGPVLSGSVPRSNAPKIAPQQHLGRGPIDMNNLPADILDCDICRQRLGLPPLSKSAALPKSETIPPASIVAKSNAKDKDTVSEKLLAPAVPMLGSPGLISSGTASQMAAQGVVVEEFRTPQSEPNAIRLGDIPPEVRQEFMRGLDLPAGAKVMSAEIKGNANDQNARISNAQEPNAIGKAQPEPIEALAAATPAELLNAPSESTQTQIAELTQKHAELEKSTAEKLSLLNSERNALTAENNKLKAQIEELQMEWQKRMELADVANREALNMLEKRTSEVTELQLQLKAQKEVLAKLKAMDKGAERMGKPESEHPDSSKKTEAQKKPDGKKSSESKNKSDEKSIDGEEQP